MITLEYETPVCSFVIMWSTPSSKKAQVVGRSADAGGIGKAALEADMVAIDQGGSAKLQLSFRPQASDSDDVR